MPAWLTIAKGPTFLFVLLILVLGLLRLFILTAWDVISAIRKAVDKRLPLGNLALQTISWLIPFNRIYRSKAGYSFASFSMHLAILTVTLFLRNHLDILEANVGLSWISISKPILDFLTLVGIVGMIILLLNRLYSAGSRYLSGFSDYSLLILLLNIFMSGYLAGRSWNPIPHNGLMLFHIINGAILALLTPFSKLAHCALYPFIRLGTKVSWHFTPKGGSETVKTLHGPEGRQI
jgi:nitrate reductase gamma subunit